MAKAKENEVYTYRVTPTGDGRYFTYRKFDTDGQEVEVGSQLFMSEADAEKAVRSLITGDDVLAVSQMKSVDAEDNAHVVHEVAERPEETHFGAAVKYVAPAKNTEGDNDFRPVDDSVTPAMKAVEEGTVAPEATTVERTAAEQKAVDTAQAKADKEAEKAADAAAE